MTFYTIWPNFFEVHGTNSEDISLDTWTARVQLQGPWEDRYIVADDILRNRRVYPKPNLANAPRAVSVSWSMLPTQYVAAGQIIYYDDVLMDVVYSSDTEATLVSESLEPNVEFITLDHKNFRWDNANGKVLKEEEAPGRQFHSLAINRTLFNVATIPNALFDEAGKVNANAYTSNILGKTFAAETLLLAPSRPRRTITTQGIKSWTLNMRFIYKPDGWNKFWRSESEAYQQVWNVKTGAVYKNYPLGNFQGLLF